MTVTHSDIARLRMLLDQEASTHSMLFLTAATAFGTLLASGAAEKHGASKCAAVAYDCADAFLQETVTRLLPGASGSG